MTVVLVDPDAAVHCLPQPAAVRGPYAELVDQARRHRPGGREDLCGTDGCGWHWPCPPYTHARLALIRAGVDPVLWAAALPVPGWATPGGAR